MLGRGCACRKKVLRKREEELTFLGMASKSDNYDSLLKEKNVSYTRRKQVQIENREGYESALESLKEKIIEEEGAETRDEFRRERTSWITDRIAQAKFPDNLDQYYTSKQSGPGTGTGIGIALGLDNTAGGKSDIKDKTDKKRSKESKGAKDEKEGRVDKAKRDNSRNGKDKDKGLDASATSKPQPKSEVSPLKH